LRVQLAEDSQRHLDRARMAETQILGLRASLTRAEAERDTYAKSNVSALIALNSAFAYAEALAGALERARDTLWDFERISRLFERNALADAAAIAEQDARTHLAAWRAWDEADQARVHDALESARERVKPLVDRELRGERPPRPRA